MEGMTDMQQHAYRMCCKDVLATMDTRLAFHNERHVIKVFQGAFDIASEMPFLTKNELVMLSLVALAHDAGHSGVTNNQHCLWDTAIFKTYGNKSTNECMHADVAVTIFRRHNIFKLFESDITDDMVRTIILSTDIINNSNYIHNISKFSPKEHLYIIIIKAADMTHSRESFEECSTWAINSNKEIGLVFNPQNEARFLSNAPLEIYKRLWELYSCDKFKTYIDEVHRNIRKYEDEKYISEVGCTMSCCASNKP